MIIYSRLMSRFRATRLALRTGITSLQGFSTLAIWIACCGSSTRVSFADSINYARDIKPILSNHCFNCHGPDEASRKSGLRLDQQAASRMRTESGALAIVPGDVDASELITRIDSTDDGMVMPPPETQKPLSAEQRELLRRWIAAGAEYAPHWAFVSPQRPPFPNVRTTTWPRNQIDLFVLQRLEVEGLSPAPDADRATWLRRVYLDLTGLPPSPHDARDFLEDSAADAYERVVDRLLQSPRYGERMAMHWLDAARFADTNGYNNDDTRTMWPWRDWLIHAFATGMSYDRFLTEQLAGDLIPNASISQKVASGFNRNHVLTTEGGVIEEEYHVEYVADRVHTTSTVFLGISLQCARCHDHKFDPFTQREYYRFAAFFDNISDKIVEHNGAKMAGSLLKAPTSLQQAEQVRLSKRLHEIGQQLVIRAANVDADLATWERSLSAEQISTLAKLRPIAHFPLDHANDGQVLNVAESSGAGSVMGNVLIGPGKVDASLEFDGQTFVEAGQVGTFDSDQPFSMVTWFLSASNGPAALLSKLDEADEYRGYDVIIEDGKIACHFVHHWPDRAFKVLTKEPVTLNEWHHLVVAYDGSRAAAGVRVIIDGNMTDCEMMTDRVLDGSLLTSKSFHIGQRQTTLPFTGRIDDVQLYSRALTLEDSQQIMAAKGILSLIPILQTPVTNRSSEQSEKLQRYFLSAVDPASRQLRQEQTEIERLLEELDKSVPVTMTMSEMEARRETFILQRGQYDQRREVVDAGVPDVFSAVERPIVENRLELARWLTDPANPLTARVAVNRWWEMFFGVGLVETVEDFGVQGSPPSHPELLDWLATELVRTHWDTQAILKLITLSSTYRQSSRITSDLLHRDPHNRLLAHGPRYRLPAETVRDNALAISGLLAGRIGGASVKPYQPDGLWEDVSVLRRATYVHDTGEDLYRRGMYTFWKRTCPPPTLSTFDAPDRETCVVRRAQTNTPLQSLVLLNDPTYVEAARMFAQRTLIHSDSDDERLKYAYQLALSRQPRLEEQQVLLVKLKEARAWFKDRPTDAEKLVDFGQSKSDIRFDREELAAWTTVTSMILNLDETISKR